MTQDSLGDRMKGYEECFSQTLPRRMPVIIRLDGKAFHTLTRDFEKPFDKELHRFMCKTAEVLCKEVQCCALAYTQSDEISLLLHGYKRLQSESWFDNSLQKMVSVAASIAGATFTLLYERVAFFDARAFVLPESDVNNYFVWRQQDAIRNSVQALAQSMFSPKELHGKNNVELLKACGEKGVFWTHLDLWKQRGSCVLKKDRKVLAYKYDPRFKDPTEIGETVIRQEWTLDEEIPIFSEDKSYVERLLKTSEA